ncbi:MAG: thioesterase family protein [Trueperaceae bacterium]
MSNSRLMDPLSYSQRLLVEDVDIDDLGHVNNAVFLQWVEACCRAHAERQGMPTEKMLALGALPVVRRHVATYRQPGNVGDRIEVSTRIVRVRGPLASRHNEVRRLSDGKLLVDVKTDWVWIDPASGKPKAPPPEVLAAFGLETRG